MAEQKTDGGRAPASVTPTDKTPSSVNTATAVRPNDEELRLAAEDRERQMARSRGVDDDDLDELAGKTNWYMSNRRDDRTVLWERDARHPGGEALIGPSPKRAYLTPGVQEKLFRTEIIKVPEPRRTMHILSDDGQEIDVPNRKYPQEPGPDPAIIVAAQPGRPVPLGRKLDPDLYDEPQRKEHLRALRGMPAEIAVPQGVIVGG